MWRRALRGVGFWLVRRSGLSGPRCEWREWANGSHYWAATMYETCPCPKCSPGDGTHETNV